MASFTPVDVVRLAAVSRLRVSDEDLQPVADALIIHLASAEMSISLPSSTSGSSPRRRSPASMTILA